MYERLLDTINTASAHPFYREHWGQEIRQSLKNSVLDESSLHELVKSLPFISKKDLRKIKPWNVETSPIVSIRHTTGSTGEPLYRYRGAKELVHFKHLPTNNDQEIALHLLQTYHGGASIIDTGTINFYCNVLDEGSLQSTVKVLKNSFSCVNGKSVNTIYAPWPHLLLMTSWLKSKNIDAKEFSVSKVILFGGHFSPFIKKTLEDYWGNIVGAKYSLSEVAYASSYVEDEGYKLKSSKDCMVHLVPYGENFYQMAFTELLPLGFNQPVIKYKSGDIVRLKGKSFQVMGRVNRPGFPGGSNS